MGKGIPKLTHFPSSFSQQDGTIFLISLFTFTREGGWAGLEWENDERDISPKLCKLGLFKVLTLDAGDSETTGCVLAL